LARVGTAFNLDPQVPRFKEIHDLRNLPVPPAGLVKGRTRLRNRAHTQDLSVLKRQTKVRLTLAERQITELDAEIATLIEARESTARTCDILRSVPGVGAVSVAAMLTLMPELGTLDRKQVASLAGLAPTHTPVRAMAGQSVHQKRAQTLARCPLHARIGRHALEPRPQGKIRASASRGKIRQSRNFRYHAKAYPNRECAC
jgi:transposase